MGDELARIFIVTLTECADDGASSADVLPITEDGGGAPRHEGIAPLPRRFSRHCQSPPREVCSRDTQQPTKTPEMKQLHSPTWKAAHKYSSHTQSPSVARRPGHGTLEYGVILHNQHLNQP